MSFSLRLQHGDLALNGVALDTVENADKLQQDLICDILTPLGFDQLHPNFGSTLIENLQAANDTGVLGTRDFRRAATLVHAELVRICQDYQAQQIARRHADGVKFGRVTLTPEEILVAIRNVAFTQVEDRLICVLTLEIGTEEVNIRVPMST